MKMNKFTVKHQSAEAVNRLYLSGELDLSTAPQLRSEVEPLLKRKGEELILNFRSLDYIDSTGIGVIISILKACEREQMVFKVEEIQPNIKRLFDLTGISKFLKQVLPYNEMERTEN